MAVQPQAPGEDPGPQQPPRGHGQPPVGPDAALFRVALAPPRLWRQLRVCGARLHQGHVADQEFYYQRRRGHQANCPPHVLKGKEEERGGDHDTRADSPAQLMGGKSPEGKKMKTCWMQCYTKGVGRRGKRARKEDVLIVAGRAREK